LFGSEFELIGKGFESIFVCGSKTKSHKGRFIRVNFSELLNTYKPNFQQLLINNTSEFFSFNMWERFLYFFLFLNELNLTYQRLISFVASFDFIAIVLVPWDKFSLCHTPTRLLLTFQDQISILIVGCATTWSQGSHQK